MTVSSHALRLPFSFKLLCLAGSVQAAFALQMTIERNEEQRAFSTTDLFQDWLDDRVVYTPSADSQVVSFLKLADLEPDDTYSALYKAGRLPTTPTFVFVHLEKSAGSFLGSMTRLVLGDEAYLGYHDCGKPIKGVPENYFVVSSIRNPCDQHLSQWSYCCEKAWVLDNLGIHDNAAQCGKSDLDHGLCPVFSGSRQAYRHGHNLDIEDLNVGGFAKNRNYVYEQQFNSTFSEIGPERVNCWIHTESIVADTENCLREFAKLPGVKLPEEKLSHAKALLQSNAKNEGHHTTCSKYYTNPAVTARVKKASSFLFNYFDYETCCR